MQSAWYVIHYAEEPPALNMALDEALLNAVNEFQQPVLRFYGWSRSAATFGYFQKYQVIETLTSIRPLIRRPTGGGLVLHQGDWTYSLVFPLGHDWYRLKAMESYERIHAWIARSFQQVDQPVFTASAERKVAEGQCFVGYEKFDVIWKMNKIAGAAQRRNQKGLLIQGSIQPGKMDCRREEFQAEFMKIGTEDSDLSWHLIPSSMMESIRKVAIRLAEKKYECIDYNKKK